MVVEVVPADVGENGPTKDARDAVLHQTVRTHLHKGDFAASIHHIAQMLLKDPRVRWCGSQGTPGVNGDAHGGQQSSLYAAVLVKLVEEGGRGGLAIRACNANHS